MSIITRLQCSTGSFSAPLHTVKMVLQPLFYAAWTGLCHILAAYFSYVGLTLFHVLRSAGDGIFERVLGTVQ